MEPDNSAHKRGKLRAVLDACKNVRQRTAAAVMRAGCRRKSQQLENQPSESGARGGEVSSGLSVRSSRKEHVETLQDYLQEKYATGMLSHLRVLEEATLWQIAMHSHPEMLEHYILPSIKALVPTQFWDHTAIVSPHKWLDARKSTVQSMYITVLKRR